MGIAAESMRSLSMIASGAGAVVGAMGALDSAEANAGAAAYQAGVARNNQILMDQNAAYALQAGRVAEQNQRQRTKSTIGAQRAQMAANGVALDSGSPLRLQTDTAALGELDALTVRNNALRQAINYRQQGADFGANAGFLDDRAEHSRTAGNIGAIGSIVGGASAVSDKWLRWKTPSPMASRRSPEFTDGWV